MSPHPRARELVQLALASIFIGVLAGLAADQLDRWARIRACGERPVDWTTGHCED